MVSGENTVYLIFIHRLNVTEMFLQNLWDEVARLTLSHAATVEKVRLQQRDKERETQRLFAHTDELNLHIKV